MFLRLSKHLEFRQKYSPSRRIFNSLLGVWISRWNTVSRGWWITSAVLAWFFTRWFSWRHHWLLCPVIVFLVLSGVPFIVMICTTSVTLRTSYCFGWFIQITNMFLFCFSSFLIHAVKVSLIGIFFLCWTVLYWQFFFYFILTAYVQLSLIHSCFTIVVPFIW